MSSTLEDNLGMSMIQTFDVNSIKNLTSEHEESMEIETEAEFDLESENFNLDQIVDSAVDWAYSPSVPHYGNESLNITSNEATPFLELKALPEHLKYAYLDGRETLSVIIASHLTEQQEDNLLSILKRHREAIGWTMKDIKGIPRKDPQRRLNQLMQEAVKTEILKLLDNGLIYLISDS